MFLNAQSTLLGGPAKVRQPMHLALLLVLLVATTTVALAMIHLFTDTRVEVLLRDPNGTARQPEYYGIVSNIGILCWATAAAVSLFCGLALRRQGRHRRDARILLAGGIFTAVLCLDDLFMLHEGLFKRMGVAEAPILLAYGGIAIAWVAASGRRLLDTEWLLHGLALAGLGGSVLLDLAPFKFPGVMLLEDMMKFFGILCWTAYFLRLAWSLLPGGRAAPYPP